MAVELVFLSRPEIPNLQNDPWYRLANLQWYAKRKNLPPPNPEIDLCNDGILVSIVIPAYHEAEFIGDTLRSLDRNNTNHQAEIIVTDNGSRDKTKEVVSQASRELSTPIVLLEEKKPGPGWARKKAADEVISQLVDKKITRPHFLAMIDADTEPDKGWIDSIVRELSKPKVHVLGGTYRYPDWLDQEIEKTTGIKNLFGELSQIAHFLTVNECTLPQTFGPNAAFDVTAYAMINGSEQPIGEDAIRDDWIMGDKMRDEGFDVAVNPVQTITSPRRALLSIVKRVDPSKFYSSGKGGEWAKIRGDARKILEVALKKLTPEQWKEERAIREYYYVLRSLVMPLLRVDVPLYENNLESLLGPEIKPFLWAVRKMQIQRDLTTREEIEFVSAELSRKYAGTIMKLAKKAISTMVSN